MFTCYAASQTKGCMRSAAMDSCCDMEAILHSPQINTVWSMEKQRRTNVSPLLQFAKPHLRQKSEEIKLH